MKRWKHNPGGHRNKGRECTRAASGRSDVWRKYKGVLKHTPDELYYALVAHFELENDTDPAVLRCGDCRDFKAGLCNSGDYEEMKVMRCMDSMVFIGDLR